MWSFYNLIRFYVSHRRSFLRLMLTKPCDSIPLCTLDRSRCYSCGAMCCFVGGFQRWRRCRQRSDRQPYEMSEVSDGTTLMASTVTSLPNTITSVNRYASHDAPRRQTLATGAPDVARNPSRKPAKGKSKKATARAAEQTKARAEREAAFAAAAASCAPFLADPEKEMTDRRRKQVKALKRELTRHATVMKAPAGSRADADVDGDSETATECADEGTAVKHLAAAWASHPEQDHQAAGTVVGVPGLAAVLTMEYGTSMAGSDRSAAISDEVDFNCDDRDPTTSINTGSEDGNTTLMTASVDGRRTLGAETAAVKSEPSELRCELTADSITEQPMVSEHDVPGVGLVPESRSASQQQLSLTQLTKCGPRPTRYEVPPPSGLGPYMSAQMRQSTTVTAAGSTGVEASTAVGSASMVRLGSPFSGEVLDELDAKYEGNNEGTAWMNSPSDDSSRFPGSCKSFEAAGIQESNF